LNQIKKAMILAAGLGLRARPLTLVKPKALFPVLNRPVISYNLDLLAGIGVQEVAVNTHHLAAQLERQLSEINNHLAIHTFREEKILGTGGGVKNAAPFLGQDPFILINGVILTSIDLSAVVGDHMAERPMATLVLHDCPRFNNVGLDSTGLIRGFRGEWAAPPEGLAWRTLAFTGIHIIEPELLAWIPEGPYDIIHTYQALIKAGARVRAFVANDLTWRKIETRLDYLKIHGDLLTARAEGPVFEGSEVEVNPEAVIQGWASLDEEVIIEAGALVKNSVLWKGARVAAGVRIVNSVLAEGVLAESDLNGGAKID